VEIKQVFGRDGMVVGMGGQTFAFVGWRICFLFSIKLQTIIGEFFFRLVANVECMQRAGVRGHFTIHRYSPCQRALNMQIALKPA
jgi:hypothetical protein